jgi:acetyl esterase/lipase
MHRLTERSQGFAAKKGDVRFPESRARCRESEALDISMRIPLLSSFAAVFLCTVASLAESPATSEVTKLPNVSYKSGEALSSYESERCKLDVYLPANAKGCPTLVWFHGGGLTGGSKDGVDKLARSLAAAGLAVVVPNYRLSPRAKFPAYIEDAAVAFAWAKTHMAEHGGDTKRLFIGGHSAGGYLTLMLGMDAHFLDDLGIKPGDVAGFIPISGQTMTHYTVRQERGIAKLSIIADEAAPVHFARNGTPPFLVLYADHDMAARAEENAYFVALMRGAGNLQVTGQMITDRTHGSIASKIAEEGDPARKAILTFVGMTR